MNKIAWHVGESVHGGEKVHTYLWIDTKENGLFVSDEHNFHSDLAEEEGLENRDCLSRGMIILHPDNKTADVFAYRNNGLYGHSDAPFVSNDVWRELQRMFKGYKLEEKQGLSEAVSNGRFRELPNSVYRKPLFAGWRNYLLYHKVGGFMDNKSDLDSYDSEIAHDLYELHDQIMQNPVRDTLTRGSEYYQQRGFEYTYKALKNRLIPAVLSFSEDNKNVRRYIAKANKELSEAYQRGKMYDWSEGAMHLERAFSFVHNAIDEIRHVTRKVPEVRHLTPEAIHAHLKEI